uniref:Cystatin domain-containing protein n=1 Tax=Steinernema glaseri TaxID=37863 RepID=A0A1I7YD97_9BILA
MNRTTRAFVVNDDGKVNQRGEYDYLRDEAARACAKGAEQQYKQEQKRIGHGCLYEIDSHNNRFNPGRTLVRFVISVVRWGPLGKEKTTRNLYLFTLCCDNDNFELCYHFGRGQFEQQTGNFFTVHPLSEPDKDKPHKSAEPTASIAYSCFDRFVGVICFVHYIAMRYVSEICKIAAAENGPPISDVTIRCLRRPTYVTASFRKNRLMTGASTAEAL